MQILALGAVSVTLGQIIVIFTDSQATIKNISYYNLYPSELEFKCKQLVDSFLSTAREVWSFNGSFPIAAFVEMNKPTSWPKRLRRCIPLIYRFYLEIPSDLSGIKSVKKEYPFLKSCLMVNLGLVYSMLNFLFSLGWKERRILESLPDIIIFTGPSVENCPG
ncbi:hypothetical protein TNCV_1628271 [Trichonephila clavipes]|nr:hypothetical protein TNCV_1628271 [Trichonephila clavipes]